MSLFKVYHYIVQIAKAIVIMNKEGVVHHDLNVHNIGIIDPKQGNIMITDMSLALL